MAEKPSISIVLTFHNQRSIVESTLSSIFELRNLPFELIIIDDASTDGSADAITSLLEYYDHDQTYFFQHEETAGRGSCLNEALLQCTSPLLWCPASIEHIDGKRLKEVVMRAGDATQGCFVQQLQLPESENDWLSYIARQHWADDGSYIWDLTKLSRNRLFFNPYQQQHHCLELACRLFVTGSCTFAQVERYCTTFANAPVVPPSTNDKKEMIYTLLRYLDFHSNTRRHALMLLDEISKNEEEGAETGFENEQLAEALQMKQEGRLGSALELVEQVLQQNPGHPEAKKLKIQILERKRRFVEASELKHEMTARSETDHSPVPTNGADVSASLIVPTALYGKDMLEHCLISVSEHCDPKRMELIVIDNASLDDTHDYLEGLKEKGFFNCKVITNSKNRGFAASVNQGLEAASGEYACVIHNDIVLNSNIIDELAALMDENPRYAVIAPMSNKTLNPEQSLQNAGEYNNELVRTEYLDSFCMMVRTNTGLRMDEEYQLAFFEDIDYCFQARKEGYRVGIATGVSVEHHYGTTTFGLNLDTESEQYWKNVAYFNEKWGIEVFSEEDLKSRSRFDQLLAIDEMVNPLFPEESLKAYFHELFTDELKTEMMRSDHDPETLCRLTHLMMVMEERELMRRLEDRLEDIELPASLIYQLVRFYFNRNIYSRCHHYLEQLKAGQQSLQSELYKLQMLVGDKELGEAIPKLKELLEKAPSNPTLYKIAGDIHQFEGNQEEAKSFYTIAAQINPFEYSESGETEFKIKS